MSRLKISYAGVDVVVRVAGVHTKIPSSDNGIIAIVCRFFDQRVKESLCY
jgi:hypothetical protein